MPQSTNLNKAPYFDDFDPVSNFYRVLFRPGYSIQSRELTTLQSILQNQIENLARSNFKQGSIVVPGEIIFDSQYAFVKVSSFTNNLLITDYIGKKMTGNTTGVIATVVNATASTDTDSATLFVKYESSGTTTTQQTFAEGETITADSPGRPTAIVGISGNVKPTTSPAMGFGAAVTVQEGIYFINGSLVRNNTETIILSKYSSTPTAKVGFVITEQLTTPEEDFSLLDNAQGYSNFSAPGAHRLKISLSLTSRTLDAPDQKDFVQLLLIQGGNVISTVETTTGANNILNDILARRTFDESGDYVVRDFAVSLKENLDNGSNNGVFTASQGGLESKFVAALNPGKAYVKGYEIETTSVRYISIDKARDTETQENTFISALEGTNYTIKNLYSFPDIEGKTQNLTGTGILSTNPYQELKLYDTYSDAAFGDTSASLDTTSPEGENFWVLSILNPTGGSTVPTNTGYSVGGVSGQIRIYTASQTGTRSVAIVTKNESIDHPIGSTITMGAVSGVLLTAEKITTAAVGIAKTKYLKFLSGNSSSGIYNKNSSKFKLGLFGTEYFTKILCKNPLNFSVGKFITGQSSGSVGVVEEIKLDTNELILSQVSGKFAAGETILSELDGTTTPYNFIEEDGNIAYIKTVSVGSGYTTTSGLTISLDGVNKTSVIDLANVTITSGQLRSIKITSAAREALGTYVTSPVITVTSPTGNGASFVVILNKNNVIDYDSSLVRSYFNSTSGNFFAGDIDSIQDTFNVANGATFSATEGSYFISADNLSSRPDVDLIKGDIIEITDNANVTRKYIVRFASRESSSTTGRIYIHGCVLSTFTAKTVARIRSKLNGLSGNTLLLPLPNKNVQTTVLDPNNTNINYTVQKEFLGNFDANGTAVITVGTNETLLSFSSDNYILSTPTTGNLIDISNSVTLGNNAQSVTISLGASFANLAYKLIAPVKKNDTVPKTKTLVTNQEYQVATGFFDPIIPLQFADGYKLKAIYMSSTGADATVNDVNVTDRFIFDGGQRDTYYDLARIIRKPDAQVPANKLLVVYDYFKHVGGINTGDYFTVDSYTNISYQDIPSFTSSVYGNISLRDVVDFRPRVSDYTGLGTETVLPGYSDFITKNSLKFNGVGASAPLLPIFGTSFDTGYKFYLNRIDGLYISKDGSFSVSRGTPSLNPQIPQDISDSILLYHFNIPAYTFNTSDIQVKSFDNRRYTMRDIGKLEKRIEKLEYYTVLSLLEQDTFNTQVRDEFGNDRFKNGILVDNYEGHNVGNTTSADYSCSIDTQTGVCRPSYYASQTKLLEKNSNNSQRTANGYTRRGELITLPFTEQSTVSNPYATKTLTINPGKSAKFSGLLTLDPNIDEWKDTTSAPELITNENSIFDTIQNNSENLWGSFWNEWQVAWTGFANYNLSNSTSFNGNGTTQFTTTADSVVKGKTRSRTRNGTQNRLTPYGASTSSFNQKVVSSAYVPYIRSNVVKFVARGLEPSTRLYAFFDGIDVSEWVNPDDVSNITTPFTGIAGYAEKGFGTSIITDANGNISGTFMVPNGYAPFAGKKLFDLQNSPDSFYKNSGTQRKFSVGTKTFRLTSSLTNSSNNSEVTTFAETEYTALGNPVTSKGTIISTRVPSISRRSASNSDTVQLIGTTTVNVNQSGLLDPLSQTFNISGYEEGVFLSSIDLFFNSKSNADSVDTQRPVSVYLVETNGGVPTRNIVPFSEVSLSSDTILRIKMSNDVPAGITISAGETISGRTSGATGTIKNAATLSSANTRYNLILSNHNGIEFIAGEEIVINRSPAVTASQFFIDQDSGIIEKIKVNSFGSAYTASGTTISINGDNGGNFGVVATASPKIYNGLIYEINVTNNGSGYYTPPTVTITGGDGLATAEAIIRITNPAVKMGIATSTDASVRTRFYFPSPVYLQNETTYAFVVTSSSSDYRLYSSRVGDALLNSVIVASNQPLVGSLYKSQNSSSWIEDSLEDIKFTINRCVFNRSATATVEFINDNVDYVTLPSNPFTVDNTLGTSSLFGANQRIIRVNHPNHGMKEGDTVILSNVIGTGSPSSIFGVPVSLINGIHSVSNVGQDDYCIFIDNALWTAANPSLTGSGTGGGTAVRATTNKLYQIVQPQIGVLAFPSSSISQTIRTAFGKAVDSSTTNEYTLATAVNVTPGDNYYFENSRVIASRNNEVYRNNSTLLNGKSSVSYTVALQTSRDNVSPVIDVNRANIITVGSRIDAPTGNEDRFGTKSQILSVPTSSVYSITTVVRSVACLVISYENATGGNFTVTVDPASRITQSGSGASAQIANVDLVNRKLKLIDIVGTFVPNNSITQGSVAATATSAVLKAGQIIGWDSGTGSLKVKLTSTNLFEVGDIINDETGTSPQVPRTITKVADSGGFLFVPETNAFSSSSISKYVTKEVTLETPGTALDCKITANLFDNKDIKVLYKIRPDGSTEDFNKISWQFFNGTGYSDNVSSASPSTVKAFSPSVEDLDSYIEYKYTANALKPFSAFAIKVVFVGSNPALAPRLEDLRVIAHS